MQVKGALTDYPWCRIFKKAGDPHGHSLSRSRVPGPAVYQNRGDRAGCIAHFQGQLHTVHGQQGREECPAMVCIREAAKRNSQAGMAFVSISFTLPSRIICPCLNRRDFPLCPLKFTSSDRDEFPPCKVQDKLHLINGKECICLLAHHTLLPSPITFCDQKA